MMLMRFSVRLSASLLPLAMACAPALADAAATAPAGGPAVHTAAAAADASFPYKLVGRMRTPDGHDAVVLARGSGVYVAMAGGVLDDTWRVESLTRDAIEVTHLRNSQRQTILLSTLPAAPASAPVSYANPAMPVREMTITRDMDPAEVRKLLIDPPSGVVFRVEPPDGAPPPGPAEAAAPPPYDPLNPPPSTASVPREIELPSGAKVLTRP